MPHRRAWLLFLSALLALAWRATAGAQPVDRPLVILFSDVGQGDATLIRSPEGKHILIDAGPSAAAMERLFFEFVPDTLDLVIASHNHSDHIGGMVRVFERFAVRAYMDNGVPHTTRTYARTVMAVEREPGVQYLRATDRTIKVGSVTLRVLPPPLLFGDQNDNSVGVLLEFGEFRALLTGDSEVRELAYWLAERRVPRVHVLKGAHHGALNGVTAEWIRATRPGTVVISLGANEYGHPDPRVVQAWRNAGAEVYRTDLHGSVVIAAKADGTFETFAANGTSVSAPVRPR